MQFMECAMKCKHLLFSDELERNLDTEIEDLKLKLLSNSTLLQVHFSHL